jgi:flagellar motor protein MotB
VNVTQRGKHGRAAALENSSSLGSKGYGKTKPVADNNSAKGAARNRRVEISKLNCTG